MKLNKYFWLLLAGLAITFWWLAPLVIAGIVIGWVLREQAAPFINLWKQEKQEKKKDVQ